MNPAYMHVRVVSLHLSRVLDEIGLNQVTIARRRRTHIYNEKVKTILFHHLVETEVSCYIFGSQVEGTTTPGLKSDVDLLFCFHDINVIEDLQELQKGRNNLLMLQDETAPGYCRLQLLRDDIPMVTDHLLDKDCTHDERGRVLLENTCFSRFLHEQKLQSVRNGPAYSLSSVHGQIDRDQVYAYQCISWPVQADEFIRRHRTHGWPSRRLLQEATEHGVFLVPVGHKLSPTEHLEWRISTSSAERCLMLSLSTVHMKCYVVLKMLMKTFVDPHIRKCISSYHCKTALLYCTENNEAGFWREDNLLHCVNQCLVMLLTWVTDGFCPHFIMPEANLFAGKVTDQNRDLLRSIFTSMVQSKGSVLLRVCIDDIGHKLHTKLNTEPTSIPILDSLATVSLIGKLEYVINCIIRDADRILLLTHRNTKPVAIARFVQQKLVLLRDRIRQTDKLERHAIQAYIKLLSSWLGSLLASIALSRRVRVPRTAIKLLRSGAKFDISFSMLKLASVYYTSGDLRKGEELLQRIEAHFCRNEIEPACTCYNKPLMMYQEDKHALFVSRGRKVFAGLFAHCITFFPQEIHCAPPAMMNELYRAVGDDVKNRHPIFDIWMYMAVVDCLPYLHYLQYLTYRQLGKRDLQTRSLYNLERCIREDHIFGHLETAWNMLGQCREIEHEPEEAMTCYRKSLEIRPRNNAANWHLQNLRNTAIRNGVKKMRKS